MKDELKKRRYRWSDGKDGRSVSWFTDIGGDVYETEMKFLRHEICSRDLEPFTRRTAAFERFRAS